MSQKKHNITEPAGIPDNFIYYWSYQYRLGKIYLLPYLKRYGAFTPGSRVVEIGSAEAGVLGALVEAGAVAALATDIVPSRLEMGLKIAHSAGWNIDFVAHNILSDPILENWAGRFDLCILRDVIEHLESTAGVLLNIKKLLRRGGFLFVTFPPYWSAYGGHQHTVGNKWGSFPFLHYLPNPIFHRLIRSGTVGDVAEVKRLQSIRLTPSKFLAAARLAGYKVVHRDYYLIRPVFKIKYGLPPVKFNWLAWCPIYKNIFALEACYILKAL